MAVSLSKGKKQLQIIKQLVFDNKMFQPLVYWNKTRTGRTHQIRVHMSYKGNCI